MPSLSFSLKPSKWYNLFIVSVFIICAAQIALTPIAISWRVALLALLTFYTARLLWSWGLLRGKHAIVSLRKLEGGDWELHSRQQTFAPAQLQGQSITTNWVLGLSFRLPGYAYTLRCVVFPDSLGKEQFRQLTMLVKQ